MAESKEGRPRLSLRNNDHHCILLNCCFTALKHSVSSRWLLMQSFSSGDILGFRFGHSIEENVEIYVWGKKGRRPNQKSQMDCPFSIQMDCLKARILLLTCLSFSPMLWSLSTWYKNIGKCLLDSFLRKLFNWSLNCSWKCEFSLHLSAYLTQEQNEKHHLGGEKFV